MKIILALFMALYPFIIFPMQADLVQIREELRAKHQTDSTSPALEIINVSYDPTREFYEKYNALFSAWWKTRTKQDISIIQSHGGSGNQARAIISGLDADAATLASALDIDNIEKYTGAVGKNWEKRLPNDSVPYYSTVVFLVRKGNPKQIKDWKDLSKNGIRVITPNPKTSGGGRWTYLAAWSWAFQYFDQSLEKTKLYMKKLYGNTLVLDLSSRAATTTFVQRMMGDVLLTWENEAYLTKEKIGKEEFEIIYPSISIRADPPVAMLEKITRKKGTEDAASFYLKYLYSNSGQKLIADHYYRPYDQEIANGDLKKFPEVKLVTVKELGGWKKIEELHFKDKGIFDEIYLQSERAK